MDTFWKKCGTCSREISFGSKYYVCSVSTCGERRIGMNFCSVACWDTHRALMRHRGDAGAVEMTAPTRERAVRDAQAEQAGMRSESAGGKRKWATLKRDVASRRPSDVDEGEILVVASRVKAYIRERSGMNTGASTMRELTKHIVRLCHRGIENARREGRKTVLDRDIPFSDM